MKNKVLHESALSRRKIFVLDHLLQSKAIPRMLLPTYFHSKILLYLRIKCDQSFLEKGYHAGINPPHPNQCVHSQINRGHIEHFTARIYFSGT